MDTSWAVRSVAGVVGWFLVGCGRTDHSEIRALHPAPGDGGPTDAAASVVETGTPLALDGAGKRRDSATDGPRITKESGVAPDAVAGPDAARAPDGAAPPPRGGLVGNYDVFIDEHSVPPGCNALNAADHLNLRISIDDAGELRIQLYADWLGPSYSDPFELDAASGEILVSPELWDVERLRIFGGDGGVSGSGEALFRYDCEGGAPVTSSIPVHIAPDTTPPRATVDGSTLFRQVFPFTLLSHRFSEPVPLMADGSYFTQPQGQGIRHDLLTYTDAETGAVVDADWRTWPWGPGLASRFSDYDAVGGRTIKIEVDPSLVDWAGNVAVPVVDTIEVIDVGPVAARHDFDLEAPVGLLGNAYWVAAGGPCETGGCVVWEGPQETCADVETSGVSDALAVRIAETTSTTRIRYRIWTTGGPPQLSWSNEDGGYAAEPAAALVPLSAPDGPYTHATDWATQQVASALGPSADQGYAFFRECWPFAAPAPHLRLVIDWVAAD